MPLANEPHQGDPIETRWDHADRTVLGSVRAPLERMHVVDFQPAVVGRLDPQRTIGRWNPNLAVALTPVAQIRTLYRPNQPIGLSVMSQLRSKLQREVSVAKSWSDLQIWPNEGKVTELAIRKPHRELRRTLVSLS